MSGVGSIIFGSLPLGASVAPPIVVLVLCIVAGVGTVMLLPGRWERSIRKIGGALLLVVFLVFVALLVRQEAMKGATQVYFWLFSGIAVTSAMRVISHEKPVYSALYFVLTVVATAGLFVLLWAEFVAAALILIYAGAILVTYVFVIMLAQQVERVGKVTVGAEYDRHSREPVLASAVGFVMMGMILFLIFDGSAATNLAGVKANVGVQGTTKQVGEYVFIRQTVSLEVAALVLTAAMIGAVIIARRQVPETRAVDPGRVAVQDDDPHNVPVYGTENPRAKAYPER